MNGLRGRSLILLAIVVMLSSPAGAVDLVPAKSVLRFEALTVSPARAWNLASVRPARWGLAWTQDGFALNLIEIFAAVPGGQTLFQKTRRPTPHMPRFAPAMLLPDIADFFERSLRAHYQLSDFTTEAVVPARLGGVAGVVIRYRYSLPDDDLTRRGEARLAVANGALYAIAFEAPALHYFDAGIEDARAMMDGARLDVR